MALKTIISGTIISIGDIQEFGTRGFRKREVLIETFNDYDDKEIYKVEATQNNVDTLPAVGTEVQVTLIIRCNKYTDKLGKEVFFTNLQWGHLINNYTNTTTPLPSTGKRDTTEQDFSNVPF